MIIFKKRNTLPGSLKLRINNTGIKPQSLVEVTTDN